MDPRGLENLQIAIIERACEDYIRGLTGKSIQYENVRPQKTIAECEKFFRSKWCSVITGDIDGEKIIEVCKIRAQYRAWRDQKNCVKCKHLGCIHRDGSHFSAIETGDLFCEKEEKEKDHEM